MSGRQVLADGAESAPDEASRFDYFDHFGQFDDLGPFWENFGSILGPFWSRIHLLPYPKALKTHILRRLGPKTILYGAGLLGYFEP